MDLNDVRKQKARLEVFIVTSWIILFVAFIFAITRTFIWVAGILFIIAGIGLWYGQTRFKRLSTSFKDSYVKKMLEEILPDCTYDPKQGIDKEVVYDSKILHKEDRYHSEDLLTGNLLGKHFTSADVHLQDVRSNGKTTTVVTVFQGRFFMIDSNKKYEQEVYIMPNHTYLFARGEDLKKIDMEYIDFNQHFDVFSRDKLATFALLKPRFMEKLVEFSNQNRKVMFGFRNETIFVAIDSRKDTFDIKVLHEINESFFDEIKNEINLVEELLSLLP